jgi:hypothetical protein
MAVDPAMLSSLIAQHTAAAQQGNQQQITANAQAALHGPSGAPQSPGLLRWMTQMPARVTTDMIDGAVHAADSMAHDGSWGEAATRVGRDVAAGTADAAASTGDAVAGLGRMVESNFSRSVRAVENPVQANEDAALSHTESQDPTMAARMKTVEGDPAPAAPPPSSIWSHARSAILDFRDAVAVKDPNLVDGLTQNVAQLAIPFAGYSKALAGVHDAAIAASTTQEFGGYLLASAKQDLGKLARNVIAPGAVTDATALQPHQARFADTLALGRHTETKLGDVLNAIAPDGSAMNAYINYLSDRSNESEAEGRFKNVIDGFGVNMIATPLLTAAASTLKQGTAGLRYLIDNGATSAGDFPRPAQATQAGKIVFHGTPHDFDEFDNSKIGTGEGAQAYGHGLYFAENPATAGHYQQMLTKNASPNGSLGMRMQDARDLVAKAGSPREAYSQALKRVAQMPPDQQEYWGDVAHLIRSGNYSKGAGRLMHVDIPDEHVNNMLDWDKPLSEQPGAAKVFKSYGITDGNMTGGDAYQMLSHKLMPDTPPDPEGSPKGWSYVQRGDEGAPRASAVLNLRGIPGIRYLDQGSRGAGKGSRNLVLFDAKHAKIVEKH